MKADEIDLDAHHDAAWEKLPVELRRQAVARLQDVFAPEFFDEVRQRIDTEGLSNWQPLFWHFGQGMEIRNVLRSNANVTSSMPPILDEDLPPLPEFYGEPVSNWDDYYSQVVEAAAGRRPIDVVST